MLRGKSSEVSPVSCPLPVTISFIGFGEVGQTFSRGLAAKARLAAWDRLFPERRGATLKAAAAEIGVAVLASAEAAIAGADVVISSVTADETLAVATEAARHLRRGQVFVDVNSAAPATKIAAARVVAASGAAYVECAVMQPVARPGLAVPILAGGPTATATAETLNRLGMNVCAVAAEYGRASATKLCRSILIKGLEVLAVESADAADAWGVGDEVFASLAETFPALDWPALTADMRARVTRHGIRRAAEMQEAAAMLAELGRDPTLALAVAAAQQRHAARPITNKKPVEENPCSSIVVTS
jgi:3-hydroxyisobutyrate dehydrogenase-like beta-hydroxyacid dehydrogenase